MRSCADTQISPWMKFGVNQNMGQDAGNLIEGGNNPKEVIDPLMVWWTCVKLFSKYKAKIKSKRKL